MKNKLKIASHIDRKKRDGEAIVKIFFFLFSLSIFNVIHRKYLAAIRNTIKIDTFNVIL